MWTVESVLVCALSMLGRPESSFPPIVLVERAHAGASPGVEAYVRHDDGRIYVVTSSDTFRDARLSKNRCGSTAAVRKLASVLVHEEVHLRQGAGEQAAYEAQLTTLTMLGSGPGSQPYAAVRRAMRYTLDQQRKGAARLMAAR